MPADPRMVAHGLRTAADVIERDGLIEREELVWLEMEWGTEALAAIHREIEKVLPSLIDHLRAEADAISSNLAQQEISIG